MDRPLRVLGLVTLLALAGSAAAQPEPRTLWTYSAFDRVTGLALSPNTTYVAAQAGALTRLDDNGTVIRSLPVGLIQRFAADSNGSVLVTVAGLETTLRDPVFKALWTYRTPAVVEAVAVAAGGARTAVGTKDGTLTLLDRDGRPVGGKKLDGPIGALGLSDDGEVLAVPVPGSLLLLDGRGIEKLRLAAESTTALAMAGDGSRVALGDADGKLRLVDPSGNEEFSKSRSPPLKVAALALSRNGSLLLAAWGSDMVAFGPDRVALWRQTFIQPVETLALSGDGSRATVAIKGGLVYGLATGFVQMSKAPERASNATSAPSPIPTPAANISTSPPAAGPPARPPVGLLAGLGATGGVVAALVLLHKRGLILLPGWRRAERGLRALPRRLQAAKERLKPEKHSPPPAPKKPPRAPKLGPFAPPRLIPRTPRVSPGTARLLRERAREEKTLENLDYMKGRGLLEEERHAALREEAVGRLKEIKQKLEEAGFKG